MDYEKKYNEALERAKQFMDEHPTRAEQDLMVCLFPELKESEDERVRKLLVWQVHRNIEDETNDLAGSIYDGIKGHDPDLEESIEDWKKCLAWLEKQEEQKPAEWSEEDKKMLDDITVFVSGYADKRVVKNWVAFLKSLRPRPNRNLAISFMNYLDEHRPDGKMCLSNGECAEIEKAFKEEDWAKVIRYVNKYQPHWKPSERQMRDLATLAKQNEGNSLGNDLISLYNDLKKL